VAALELKRKALSRRAALQAMGASALAACVPRSRGEVEGGIVGGNHLRGHRVRAAPRTRPVANEDVGIAILGAGIAGLSAAWAFERAGVRDFVVMELEDAPGGTARSGTGPITPYPWGAHYVPVPSAGNRPLVAVLEEVGALSGRDAAGQAVWAEQVLCREPQERVFHGAQWHEGLYPRDGASPDDLRQLAEFEAEMRRWSRWRDAAGRRAFAVPRARGSDAPEVKALDRQSMAEYMDERHWRSPRLRWFVEYGCRDDFGATLAQTSAWAGVHYFAARLEDDRRETAEFLTWPEGNGRLVAHLARTAGSRVRLGTLVTDVRSETDLVEIAYEDAAGRAGALRARHVVFALPRFLAPHLIALYRESPPPGLRETVYGSWMVANVTVRDRPASRGFPLAWDNVLYDSPSLGYVVATHQTGRDQGPTVFTYYLPFLDEDPRRGRERLLSTPWTGWVETILADLGPAHPGIRDLVERVDVYLWGHAMVRPRPGFMWSEALAASARPLGRIHFAHTDLSGMALFEEAQYWGIRAAEAILHERGQGFRSWLS
jgi:glycine/D-amino acid oxidase-like deaminating enzyme